MNQLATDSPQIGASSEADARKAIRNKTRLQTLGHLDGRTIASKRAATLAKTFAAELGGQLSDVQRVAVQNAAVMTAISEDAQTRRLAGDPAISLDDIVRAVSAARRAVRDLGLDRKREPAGPSLAEYLARNYAAQGEAEPAADAMDDEPELASEATGEPADGRAVETPADYHDDADEDGDD